MTLRNCILACCLLLACRPAAGQSASPAELRIVSYNIHHGRGTDGKINLERTAEVLRSAEPDLVALQEVDVETERSGGVNQIETLAELTDMNFVFGDNLDYRDGDYGNAILSRRPITEHENHLLPNLNGPRRRSALEAVINVRDQSVGFLSAHLDYQDKENRLGEARAINEIVQAADYPMILAGDINALFGTQTLEVLESRWTNSAGSPHFTFPAEDPERQIDFVLYHPDGYWEVEEIRVLESEASDHRPLLVVLQEK